MNEIFNQFEKQSANSVPLSPVSFIKRTALMFPNHPSVVYGNRRYTWIETYTRTRRLISALRKRGIKKGDTVSIIAANTPEMVEAHFAIPMMGAVLNTINIRLDADTISYILNHGESKVLIVDSELSPQVAQIIDHHSDLLVIDILDKQNKPNPQSLGSLDYETLLSEGDQDAQWDLPHDEWDAIALNYTSGSTGRPKGVVYHHRGAYLISMGTISDWALPRHPQYLYVVPLFHCNGWCHIWSITALAGTIFCTRTITPEIIYDAIANKKITHFGAAPIILGMIVNADDDKRKTFDHTVEVMTAGAPPPAAILERIAHLGFNVTQVYGLTETYGHAVMCSWNDEWNDLNLSEKSKIKSRQGARMVITEGMRIIDAAGCDVPADGETIGEIIMRGNTIMKGYLKNPDATAKAFADGWFHTEDLGVMYPNGYIQIKDRLKDIIISGGENISSVEIEGALHRHPAVNLAAVVAMPDKHWGEVPCAFIELKKGHHAVETEIINFCRDHLAGFKRPKKVIFGTLPKTATGKIQKFELRERIK